MERPSKVSKGSVVQDVGGCCLSLPLVVSRMGDAIYWTKCYLLNNSIDFSGAYPLDRGCLVDSAIYLMNNKCQGNSYFNACLKDF